jgi:MFS family permease
MVAVRAFGVSVVASILFYVAFAAMLLGSVLFLTGPWHEPILTAGLMIAPGPASAAVFAVPGARLGARLGPGPVGAAGSALFALGAVWWLGRLGATPDFAADFLPGMLIGGTGVGLVLPSLTGAAAAALAPERLATGIAVQTTGRQIGSALGIALLVAVLGGGVAGADGFRPAWELMFLGGLAAAIALTLTGPLRTAPHVSATPVVVPHAPTVSLSAPGTQPGAARRSSSDTA